MRVRAEGSLQKITAALIGLAEVQTTRYNQLNCNIFLLSPQKQSSSCFLYI